jgi:hypothetical protein
MNKKRIERRFTWLKMSFCLPGIAGCMMFSAVNAETELQDEDYWAPVEQTVVHPVWIQDRHTGESVLTYVEEPDYSLWNGQRITDYEEAIKVDASPALGVLTIEKLNINVPIYNGTDDFNLDRGAGRIKGMAKMDEDGNLGISGHRDGFFRTFKDIEVGDDIEIIRRENVDPDNLLSLLLCGACTEAHDREGISETVSGRVKCVPDELRLGDFVEISDGL